MQPVGFAVLGAGVIASTMADTVRQMDCVRPVAVAARDEKRAQAFAQRWGFAKAYGSYAEMLRDPQVELVYIATPHSHHAAHIRLCLEAGKHVLCEKAFTANAAQAEEVLALAEQKGLLLTEAIWPRYMPMADTLRQVCASGRLGRITTLTANLGYPLRGVERLHNPALAGGALLDLGVYPLTFAAILFGLDDICAVDSAAVLTDRGVDERNAVTLTYADGKTALIHSDMHAVTDRAGVVCGDQAFMVVDNINNYERLRIYDTAYRLLETVERPPQKTGYEYEVEAAAKAARAGKTECAEMPHAETIKMMRLMDSLRAQWGVRFPFEG